MFTGVSRSIAAAIADGRFRAGRTALLRSTLVAAALGLAACTTDDALSVRPEIDVGTQTAAVPRSGGMQELVPNDPYLQQADERQMQAGMAPTEVAMVQPANPAPPAAATPPAITEPAVQARPPASAPAAGNPVEVDEPVDSQSAPAPVTVAYPRMDPPVIAGPAPMPADEVSCRRELKRLGVAFSEMSPIDNGGSCRVDRPIKVSGLPGRVELKPAATLNCQMALAFAKWTRDELNPSAKRRYWSRVKTIHQMSSYSCRRINGSATMSEHSKGNAIDVGRIELASGRDIDVEKPGLFAFRTRGLLNNVREDGCEYFTTVLGPGYNYDHRNHFHFDLARRSKGRRACH